MSKFIVAFDFAWERPTVWLATWRGDPGRTCVLGNAKRYDNEASALRALERARKYRPLSDAKVMEVEG